VRLWRRRRGLYSDKDFADEMYAGRERCYFCGARNERESPDTVFLTLRTNRGEFGTWLCHNRCVPEKHRDAPGLQRIVARRVPNRFANPS